MIKKKTHKKLKLHNKVLYDTAEGLQLWTLFNSTMYNNNRKIMGMLSLYLFPENRFI